MAYYPIFLDIQGVPCVVVGGGKVAGRKAAGLVEAGASVTVISPEVTEKIRELIDNKGVRHLQREYRAGDLEGAGLVIAASSDRAVNEAAGSEALAANVPVNVVDDPGASAFIVPSTIRRGGLCVAISTAGRCPAFARRTRFEIEKAIGPEYGPFLEIMGALRESLLKSGCKGDKKDRIINVLLDSRLLDMIKGGSVDGVEKVLFDIAGQTLAGLGLNRDTILHRNDKGDGC